MAKKSNKPISEQTSMFTVAEAHGITKTVMPSREEIVESQEDVFKYMPSPAFRQKVALGITMCPNCGDKIYLAPDATRRCVGCGWWQGNAE